MKGLLQYIVIIALLFATVDALAQPLLQEKRIYLVDVTASMEGRGAVATPNIFDSVKDKLESTIGHIADKTTEVAIIPFTSNTFPEYSGTIAQKDSLTSIISKLEVKRGDTNIADAWSKAVSCLDSTKINYIFLLTDGLHNCGPSKEELFSRLEEWGDYSQGKYFFAFYVMLTPNAKEQEICRIVDATPNIWLIESMDIDASLVKTNATIRKNVFNDNSVSVYFSSNNNDVELSQVGLDINMEDNPFYEIESISKSIMTDSYQLRLREKKEKMEMPLVDTLSFRISHNNVDYPFVFFTPDYFSAIISNQGPRCLKITNHNVLNKLDAKIKFGKLKFHEPFQGPFKYLREYLEPTLNYPPFSWLRPDTLSVSEQLYLTFNEEAVRSSSNLSFVLKDSDNALLPDVVLTCDDNRNIITATNTDENEIICSIKVLPGRESGLISGPFILHASDLDSVNDTEISADDEILCEWSVNYKRKWALILWLLWILCSALALAIVYFAIRGIIKAFVALIRLAKERLLSVSKNNKEKKTKTKKEKKNMNDNRVTKILHKEQMLYSKTKSIVEKYDILEEMKELLSEYFRSAPEVYEECKERLRPNTWDALEEAWKLVFPSSHGEWVGPNALTFVLKKSNPYYEDCAFKGFTSCDYDVHGSPNFDKVTENNSIVDISDLYESMSTEQIGKRGGSKNSLQEIAQDRMAVKLEGTLKKWWAKNRTEPYDRYSAFYAWRDANDLVPHEDTNCRTMRLVFRPAHKAFTHRGGVSNSINIKSHFE